MQQRRHRRWSSLAALLSLAIVLTGALASGAGAGASHQASRASIDTFNLDKQLNARAGMILANCGRGCSQSLELSAAFSPQAARASIPT